VWKFEIKAAALNSRILCAEDARRLLDSIPLDTLKGRRDHLRGVFVPEKRVGGGPRFVPPRLVVHGRIPPAETRGTWEIQTGLS
jgi:hypothetical protein